jgi:hypothetical protein
MSLTEKLISHPSQCAVQQKLVEVEVDQSYTKTKQETVFIVCDKRLSKQTHWASLSLNYLSSNYTAKYEIFTSNVLSLWVQEVVGEGVRTGLVERIPYSLPLKIIFPLWQIRFLSKKIQ